LSMCGVASLTATSAYSAICVHTAPTDAHRTDRAVDCSHARSTDVTLPARSVTAVSRSPAASSDGKDWLGECHAEQRSAVDGWFSTVERRDGAVAHRKETAAGARAKVRGLAAAETDLQKGPQWATGSSDLSVIQTRAPTIRECADD
jgi:hypothetical protein